MFGLYSKDFNVLEHLRSNKNLYLCEGIAFTLMGIFAIILPTLFSLTLDYFLGWFLVLGAIVVGIRTIKAQDTQSRAIPIISTFLYLFLGFMFLAYPISGIMTLTLILGFFFIFDGILKIYTSSRLKPVGYWKWVLVSGITSLILAFLILVSWPTESPWVLGVLVGINFLSTGVTMLGFLWSLPQSSK